MFERFLGIKICDSCSTVYSEYEQFVICPHDYRTDLAANRDQEIKRLFHKLWSRDVHTPGYSKRDWEALQLLLQSRGIEV